MCFQFELVSLIGFHLDEQKSKQALNTLINQTRKARIALLVSLNCLYNLYLQFYIVLIQGIDIKS